MSRVTITKDPGYAATANVDGRQLTGAVSVDGETLKVGDQSFQIGSMRIIAETSEPASAPPAAPADHPAMVAASGGGAPAPTAPAAGSAPAVTGATPAADGGNAPFSRSR